ncbi:MAG: phenylalanine--tRNA ligase subunit alpha [Acidobacteria bacterium]|nr:phenylalanine--tRNA ligase subunit alpha [Acidobacteriota bacterium]
MSSPDQPTTDITEAVHRTLEQLGVHDATALAVLFERLHQQLDQEVAPFQAAATEDAVEQLRVRWLGRKQGIVRAITDVWLKSAPPELKREVGQRVNALRELAEQQIQSLLTSLWSPAKGIPPTTVAPAPVVAPWRVPTPTVTYEAALDVTLPGNRRPIGVRHILRQTIDEITKIFLSLGYSVEEGPEIESAYYNFEALNIPEDHPSRDDQDSFYIDRQTVLRTHTSPVQIRTMETRQPPIRIIVPGKVYRNETPDASHSWMFHQVEGLAVDTNITFADLKGTLDHFMKAFFGPEVRTRFRPSFFPFTEPSAEMDVSCIFCGGVGCRICKGSGWLELGGCGMVDPAVFAYVNYDASQYSGFAFGFGVERPAMLKYGIQDIQQFFQGDIRFLRQFR